MAAVLSSSKATSVSSESQVPSFSVGKAAWGKCKLNYPPPPGSFETDMTVAVNYDWIMTESRLAVSPVSSVRKSRRTAFVCSVPCSQTLCVGWVTAISRLSQPFPWWYHTRYPPLPSLRSKTSDSLSAFSTFSLPYALFFYLCQTCKQHHVNPPSHKIHPWILHFLASTSTHFLLHTPWC